MDNGDGFFGEPVAATYDVATQAMSSNYVTVGDGRASTAQSRGPLAAVIRRP